MMEQLYKDFNEKLLPKLAEGISITKDYFLDLSARYIKYLIIMDALLLGMSVILVIVSPIVLYYQIKKMIAEEKKPYGETDSMVYAVGIFCCIFFGVAFIVSFIGCFINISNLLKSIYVPELRIYEEFKYITK